MNLLSEVSQSELLHMRESGMSNKEIANALDVSYQTVLRVIGKQPPNLRKPEPRNLQPEINETPVPTAEEQDACLAILDKSISLVGDVAEYKVDCADNVLTLTIDGNSVCVSLPKISLLLKEMRTIQRHIPEMKIGNEMW